jgi:hypothetical protein
MKPITLDGRSLNRAQLAEIALGAAVRLDPAQMPAVQRAADFLAEQVRKQPTSCWARTACAPACRARRRRATACSRSCSTT